MKLYGISGLGADQRVFEALTLNSDFIAIDWIKPIENEPIESYAARLSKAIDSHEEFGILGVSFGGLVAVEIGKILAPSLVILVSSAATKQGLRPLVRFIGKTGLLNLFPSRFFDPPRHLSYWLFGTAKKELLSAILDDTDVDFAKWAVIQLVNWKNEEWLSNLIQISGKKDKLMPPAKRDKKNHLIENGEHFMIVDKADEVSQLINYYLEKWTIGHFR